MTDSTVGGNGQVKLVSIELTNRCRKRCPWCYAKSSPEGKTFWRPEVLAAFIKDLAANGIEAVSFGGGEPLEYPHFWELMDLVREISVFKSMTTNGLEIGPETPKRLAETLRKVHISIHDPADVPGAILSVQALSKTGIKAGLNFLVKGEDIQAEKMAVQAIKDAGITEDRVIFLPLRGNGRVVDMETFKEVARVLSPRFQSTFCLLGCRKSGRFVSVDWQGRVGWCSFTETKAKMEEFTYQGMLFQCPSLSGGMIDCSSLQVLPGQAFVRNRLPDSQRRPEL